MLHRREPLEEIKNKDGKKKSEEKKEEEEVKKEEDEETKPEDEQPSTLSREEEARRLREIGANDLADELVGQPEGNPEDDLCSKCKKKPTRLCKECGCQVSFEKLNQVVSKNGSLTYSCFQGMWISRKSRNPTLLRRMPILDSHELS